MLKWYNEFPSSIDIKAPTTRLHAAHAHHPAPKSLPASQSFCLFRQCNDQLCSSKIPWKAIWHHITNFAPATKTTCKTVTNFRIHGQNMHECIKRQASCSSFLSQGPFRISLKKWGNTASQHLTSLCILWPNHTSAQILLLENRAAGASLSHTVATAPEAVFLLALYFTGNHPLQENLAKLQLFIFKLSKMDFEAMNHLTIGKKIQNKSTRTLV